MITTDDIAAFGLALDIVGAIFLAKGFVLKRIGAIVRESGSYYGYNSHLRNSLVEQTIEAQIGMGFLVAGFVAQSAPYISRLAPYKLLLLGWLAIALGAASALGSRFLSRRRIDKLNRSQALKDIAEKPGNRELSEPELQRLVRLSQIQRLPGETVEQTVSRMKQILERLPRYKN